MTPVTTSPTAQSTSTPPRRRRGGERGFRRRDALSAHALSFGPNMTPMVDVVMVILIFFMASAAFLGSEWFLRAAIPFDAGRGRTAAKPNDPLALPPVRVEVVMDVDPATSTTVVSFLNISRGSLGQFLDRVKAMPRDEQTASLEVVIKPTPRVPYRDVVAAHSACDAAGIKKVGIGVSRPSDAAKSLP